MAATNSGRRFSCSIELAPALIGWKHLVASRWRLQGIPPNNNGARPLIRIEPKQKIGEANYGARTLAVAATNGFRQGMIRSMRKGIAVDHQ
jgi:hypothetical protein